MAGPESEHIYGVQLRESATDGSDFSNADADYRVLFLGEDGLLHVKDSAGTVSDPYTASGGGYDEGTSFPGSPASGDKFFHNTYDMLFFYDGTRWLCTCPHEITMGARTTTLTTTDLADRAAIPMVGDDIYLERVDYSLLVTATNSGNNGSHYWTVAIRELAANNSTVATRGSYATSAISAATTVNVTVPIGAVVGGTSVIFDLLASETGTPGDLTYCAASLRYRVVGA